MTPDHAVPRVRIFEDFVAELPGIYGFEFLGDTDCLYALDVEGSLRREVRLTLNRWVYTHTRFPVNALYRIRELRKPNGTAMPADLEFEMFCRYRLAAISAAELIPSGYRVAFTEATSPYVCFATRIRVSRWMKLHNRDYEVQWRVRSRNNRLMTLAEYPRHVERLERDIEFENLCLAVPGVESVELEPLQYLIVADMIDRHPVQRRIYRWMAENGRHFDTTFMLKSGKRTSTYDPLDRVITTLTYKHRD